MDISKRINVDNYSKYCYGLTIITNQFQKYFLFLVPCVKTMLQHVKLGQNKAKM